MVYIIHTFIDTHIHTFARSRNDTHTIKKHIYVYRADKLTEIFCFLAKNVYIKRQKTQSRAHTNAGTHDNTAKTSNKISRKIHVYMKSQNTNNIATTTTTIITTFTN